MKLLYSVNFDKMLSESEPLKILGVIGKMEYATDDFNRNLILLKAYVKETFYILHFYPEQSLLQAFPILTNDQKITKSRLIIPIRLYETPTLNHADSTSNHQGINSQVNLNVTFFTICEISKNQIIFNKLNVTRYPFFKLLDHSFKNNREVSIFNGRHNDMIQFNLIRFEKGDTNKLKFYGDEEASGFVDLMQFNQFPVEIKVDLQKVQGNIFSYEIISENNFESESGLIKLEPMVTETSIFKGRTGSIMKFKKVSLDKDSKLIYLYNRNVLWVINEKGNLLGSWFINKFITCSSRLLQEFGNSIELEKVFYDANKNLMIRIIQSKRLTAVITHRMITRYSKKFDQLDEILDSKKDMNEFDNQGLKMMVVNEILINENLLGLKFSYVNDMLLMHSQVDSNRTLVLYYWKNLVANDDCPISLSMEGSSKYQFKVLKSIVFSENFSSDNVFDETDSGMFNKNKGVNLGNKFEFSLTRSDDDFNSKLNVKKFDEVIDINDKEQINTSEYDSMISNDEKTIVIRGRERILQMDDSLDSGDMADEESDFTDFLRSNQKEGKPIYNKKKM
jgi:hypothetical protein